MDTEKSDKICRAIAKIRKMRGMSQQDLARAIGVSPRVMCGYEKGTRRLPSVLIEPVCRALQVSADELLGIQSVALDGRTIEARLSKRFRQAAELPEADRALLIQMLDTLLEKQRTTAPSTVF